MDVELRRLEGERDALHARVQELTAAQEEFLHAVSHDLRAPLRHVNSYGALLREVLQELPDAPPQVREALDFAATMQRSARRMAAMIDGLQVISRASHAGMHLVAVDVRELVLRLRPVLRGAGEVQWGLPEDVSEDGHGTIPLIRADAALFEQLMVELLTNAVKFSSGSQPQRVQVTAQAAPGGRVRLRVVDNGVGFDPAHSQGLFGVFQRLHREEAFEGVGAGLALCRRIAGRHGAAIEASAQPGAGCCVTLDWPAA